MHLTDFISASLLDFKRLLCTCKGLRIVGHESSLPHGSTVHLDCSTDLAATMIEWLLRGKVLKKGTGQSLQLTDTPSDSGNVAYICRINSTFGSQNKTVNIRILLKEEASQSGPIIPIVIVIIFVLVIVVLMTIVVILLMR